MRIAGRFFEIPEDAYNRTEADEWADGVSEGVLPNLTTWELVRAYTRQILGMLGSSESFIDAATEALGRRAGLKMAWELDAEDPTTAENPNLGML